MNAGNYYSGKYFKLMNNLTYSYADLAETASNYTPIGVAAVFKGHFDGNGKTISGIRIYLPNDSYRGLFGRINENAEVKNLTLTDAVITAKNQVGGIVGTMDGGTVTNCCVTSSVTIRAVVNQAEYHGGIVGEIYNSGSTISHCTSSATLTIENSATDCSAYGAIVGYVHANAAVEDNFAIGATVPETTKMNDYSHGAIVGEIGVNYTLERNYYHNCKVASTSVTPSGVGRGGSYNTADITNEDGAMPVFTLRLDSGISADVDTTLTHNEVNYYKLGTTVALSYTTQPAPGYEHIYYVNEESIEGDSFNMNADAYVTVEPGQLIDWKDKYAGSEVDPYLIYNEAQWNLLAERVNSGTNYDDKFFKLMEDIGTAEEPVTMMVGTDTDTKYFAGTFDGNGHKLTVSYNNTTDQHTAAFRDVKEATIKNLHVDGNITTNRYGPGGIVANNFGVTLINCRSSVRIISSHSGDAGVGGLIAYTKGSVHTTIKGCLFDGTLTATNNTAKNYGGFMGWVNCNDGATVSITNSFYKPDSTNVTSGCMTFVRSNNDNLNDPNKINITNCYYTQTLGTAQGDKVYTITPAEPVTVQLLGDAEVYDVSGITIYDTGDKGLKFDNVFYAASGNVLDLNLGVTVPFTVANYLANGNVITFNTTLNNYTLTMPEEDVTITATFSDVTWDGEGTEESPYLIYYNVQWDLLATNVNAGNYNGVYFKLMDDISVETMVGSTDRPFRGIFDGGGHTLTFNKGTEASPYDQNFCAPFKAVEAATIKNLHTTGTIYTSKQHAAGFVAQLIPNTGNFTRFISCRSSMKINSTMASDARSGGFIGSCSDGLPSFTEVVDRLSIYFEDCLFDGEFSGTATGWGGFVGYYFHCVSESGNSGMVHFTRCLFAPSAMNISTTDAYNFVRSDLYGWDEVSGEWHHANYSYPEDVMTITKLYYTITCGDLETYLDEVQPTRVDNMTNVQLRNALGDNWMIVTEEAVEKVVPTMGNVVTKTIAGYDNGGGWNLIASPIAADVAPTAVGNLVAETTTDFDLYRFNQSATLEWENYKQEGDHHHFDLESGRGYLYANAQSVNLIFTGIPYSGNGKVALDYAQNVEFAGWNLVGNPFADTVCVKDGQGQPKPYFKMNAARNELIADTLNSSVGPMEGIFVYTTTANDTVVFTPQRSRAVNDDEGSIVIDLGHEATVIDRAIVRFDEGQTLPKFQINKNSTKIYIPQDGKDYAIASVGGDGVHTVSTEMPVNFKAEENGTYTITVNTDHVEMSYLHLIDNMTGNDVDLLALRQAQGPATYTFTAKTTDYESRFRLVFSTVCEDADGDSDGTFAFISNGNIIVNGEGTLQIMDVTGRMIRCTDVTRNVSTAGMTPGVYVLRLINGNDVKTQKIVVK